MDMNEIIKQNIVDAHDQLRQQVFIRQLCLFVRKLLQS